MNFNEITFVFLFLFAIGNCDEHSRWKTIVETVNSANAGWKASHVFPHTVNRRDYKKLAGTVMEHEDTWMNQLIQHMPNNILTELDFGIPKSSIPEEFDSRNNWSYCRNIMNHIRDQGPCGSCWAVAAVGTVNDRLCIANRTDGNTYISSDDMTSCCLFGGCYGGMLFFAWFHTKHTGIVTGGDYNSYQGCKPYSIQPCVHHGSGSRKNCSDLPLASTPSCASHCTNSRYGTPLQQDLHKATHYYSVSGELDMQRAIMTGGPIETAFVVFEDFLSYKTGIYEYITGGIVGGHAVKILGWGVENGVPYWLCANSWNTDWGDNGFFKIKRGNNECFFENKAYLGTF